MASGGGWVGHHGYTVAPSVVNMSCEALTPAAVIVAIRTGSVLTLYTL